MLDEKLQSKIDLLQEQIDNLEKSGYYTEAQILTQTKPLKIELALIKDSLSFEFLTIYELIELKQRIQNAIVTKQSNGNGFVAKVSGVLVSLKKEAKDFISPNKYGMSDEDYEEGKRKHDQFFDSKKALEIEVIDAQILTTNYQEA